MQKIKKVMEKQMGILDKRIECVIKHVAKTSRIMNIRRRIT